MRLWLLVIAALVFVAPAYASSCYSNDEATAEQGVRIHSELMVIGLNCQHMSRKGDNLYLKYRAFTESHASLFSDYEKTLIRFFKRNGEKDPEATMNTLRTRFANTISHNAAKMRPDIFCQRYAPRIDKAALMKRGDIEKWAGTIYESHPVSNPRCNAGNAVN